jgi:hypothetical protein
VKSIQESILTSLNEFNPHKNPQGQIAAMMSKGYLKDKDKDGNPEFPDGKEIQMKDLPKQEDKSKDSKKEKTKQKDEPTKSESKTRQHIDSSEISSQEGANYKDKTANFISKDINVSTAKAHEYVDAIRGFIGSDYMEMRRASQGEGKGTHNKLAKDFDEFLNKSPKYKGEVHRGVRVPKEMADGFTSGAEITMKGMSSWSSDKKIADKFAASGGEGDTGHAVIFHVTNKSGASVTHLAAMPYQKEIVAPSSAKYKVLRREEKGKNTHVYLEEI